MRKTVQDILDIIREKGIEMIDFKMVDINGQYRHVTIPAKNFSEDTLKSRIGFDASNYGYAVVEKSDMVFIPDPDTAVVDPFCDIPTLSMTGNAMIIDTPENRPLPQYPRNIIKAAVEAMRASGVADTMYILPEFEFYLFDQVGWEISSREISASVDAQQSYWNSATEGLGVVVPKQKNYHIAKPFDISFECRSEMCRHMNDATCNPYFCYAAILMAGLDGIKNQIDPHENGWGPYDVNLYHLPEEEKAKLQGLPTSLDEALNALEKDNDYLTADGVFPKALIDNFIKMKREECRQMAAIPHPAEFDKYYNL